MIPQNDPLAALAFTVAWANEMACKWVQVGDKPHQAHPMSAAADLFERGAVEFQHLRTLIEAAREMVEATERWNESVESIIGRQAKTGIDLVSMKKALADLGVKP